MPDIRRKVNDTVGYDYAPLFRFFFARMEWTDIAERPTTLLELTQAMTKKKEHVVRYERKWYDYGNVGEEEMTTEEARSFAVHAHKLIDAFYEEVISSNGEEKISKKQKT